LATILSLIIDLGFILLAEFLALCSIQVLPKNIFQTLGCLFIGALPSALGVVTISSISRDYLRNRAMQLEKEVKMIKESLDNLKKEWDTHMKEFKEFEKIRKKFEKEFEEIEIKENEKE